jgi:hypothetical protein
VFERREQAYNWARERLQLKELLSDRDIPC